MSGIAYGAPQRITEVKAASDGAWEVSGFPSTFGTVDYAKDVVHRGAFEKTLSAGQPVRFLYAHDPAQVLGTTLELRETDEGLFGRFRISKTRLGEDVRTLLHDRALDSFSIGFIAKDFDYDEQKSVRNLKAVELLEISLVAMPAQPLARVTGYKAGDFWDDPYPALALEQLLEVYDTHRTAALGQAKAVAERRLAEGRKLSDRALATLERLRTLAAADAADLLRLATTPPPPPSASSPAAHAATPTPDAPAPAEAASLVEAHLRRARLRELGRAYGVSTP